MNPKLFFPLGLAIGAIIGPFLYRCAYESGEAAARERYRRSVDRIEACTSRGGDPATCRVEHGDW